MKIKELTSHPPCRSALLDILQLGTSAYRAPALAESPPHLPAQPPPVTDAINGQQIDEVVNFRLGLELACATLLTWLTTLLTPLWLTWWLGLVGGRVG